VAISATAVGLWGIAVLAGLMAGIVATARTQGAIAWPPIAITVGVVTLAGAEACGLFRCRRWALLVLVVYNVILFTAAISAVIAIRRSGGVLFVDVLVPVLAFAVLMLPVAALLLLIPRTSRRAFGFGSSPE
jgi:hypothetical protein